MRIFEKKEIENANIDVDFIYDKCNNFLAIVSEKERESISDFDDMSYVKSKNVAKDCYFLLKELVDNYGLKMVEDSITVVKKDLEGED